MQMFFKIDDLRNFVIFTGTTSVLESFLNKVSGFSKCNFVQKELQHRCFLVNIAKFLRTAFFNIIPPVAAFVSLIM